MRKPPRRAAFRQACLRFELVDVDLADPAVLVFQGAILDARESLAKLLHHGTDLVFAIPFNKFKSMVSQMEESFLKTATWDVIKKRMGSS